MSKTTMAYKAEDERKLLEHVLAPELANDPEAFVMFMYPWGKEGTPLARHKQPRGWQRETLQEIKNQIKGNIGKMAVELPPEVYREANASGRGPGKSALAAWLTHWNMSTHIGSTTIVTANTEQQLKSRTWAELGKWHTMSLNRHWFERTALSLRPADWFAASVQRDLQIDIGYYYAQAQLWSEEEPDSFAGVHNPHGLVVIYDEASGIPQPIWTVTEGFFTEPVLHRYWLVFSNPRRNTGAFFECFHKHRNSWKTRNIDSRTVEGTDLAVYQHIIDTYGTDSDEARIEVYGQFPHLGDRQFISRQAVADASERQLEPDPHAALIMGVDIARFGTDKTVFRWRQGRDARSIPAVKFKGLDNMQVAYEVAKWIDLTKPDAVCIDAGNGTGVIDRLREMKYKVNEVWFGAKSDQDEWSNKRTQMWARMRDWLPGGVIDSDPALMDDICAPEYKFQGSSDRIMLESKDDMKRRGLDSPDDGDALAVTFAVKAARRDNPVRKKGARQAVGVNEDPFGSPPAPVQPRFMNAQSTRALLNTPKKGVKIAHGVGDDV